jgi:NADPH:quinone reductase
MRAVQLQQFGGPEVLVAAEVAAPNAGPGQVVVDVTVAGVNYIDTYHRSGLYPLPLPLVPGMEGVGRISQVGEGVTGAGIGQRVVWLDVMGSYAEQLVAPAGRVVPVPDGLDDDSACALALQGATAHYLATDTVPLRPGMTALVHAAAGGVGQLLVRLAVRAGAQVVATVGSPAKAEIARAGGAHHVLDSRSPDLLAAVTAAVGQRGVDVVYDGVGQATFDLGLAVLRRRGTMVSFGNASGPPPAVAPLRLAQNGSLYLTRPMLGDYVATTTELTTRLSEVFALAVAGELRPQIGLRLPLPQARAAHEALESRSTTGKVLLTT